MKSSQFRGHVIALTAVVATFSAAWLPMTGCSGRLPKVDLEQLAAEQQRVTLSSEPAGAEGVLAVQKRLMAAHDTGEVTSSEEVVLVGQVGGMPNPWKGTHPDFPWYGGQASFFVVDLATAPLFADHAHDDQGKECPFCARRAAQNVDSIAVVNLVDEQGEIVPIDVRQLLDLTERQTVVVRGKAELVGGSLLVINADGIFVQR